MYLYLFRSDRDTEKHQKSSRTTTTIRDLDFQQDFALSFSFVIWTRRKRFHIAQLQLTIAIHPDFPAGLLPVLDDRGGRVDDCAVHVEEQGGEVDDFGRGGEVVFFVVRHDRRWLPAKCFFFFFSFLPLELMVPFDPCVVLCVTGQGVSC